MLTRRQMLATALSLTLGPAARSALLEGFPSQDTTADSAYPIPGDRWMEIDLYWFEEKDIERSVRQFWDRFLPLYAGVRGDRGLILNVGWTVSCVMEWSGDLSQRITLPKGTGEQHWVEERAPLTGTTSERMREWKERFAKPLLVAHRGYGPWTYGDLKKLADALRQEAARRGVSDFKVGILNYAWPEAYGELAPWAKRHPEAFAAPARSTGFHPRYFDITAKLHADPAPLGAFPSGIPEGLPVHRAYAEQWGNLSRAAGLQAVMLRDSFGFPVPYWRSGPWGSDAPSPQTIHKATRAVAVFVRETKQANPEALVMMYSNAASAIGDWRCNGLDLETLAGEGYLDVFVDQTWAGAWNEVGVREHDFWNNPILGYTYQLCYLLLHAATLAGTKVRHYPLTETFDAWESWDVIHSVPERLRWEIWAYSHAGVKTPRGLKMPAGSYISWANQGKRLLSDEDVHFLSTHLNAAIDDARRTTEIFGPTLVYSREAMQWQISHAAPDQDVKQWIDEQAGSVIKWPIPILSVTRMEWLPQVKSPLFILQTPSHLSSRQTAEIARLIRQGHPIAIFGSPAGGIDPELAKLGGLIWSGGAVEKQASVRAATITAFARALARNLSGSFDTFQRLTRNKASAGARTVYSVDASPVLTVNTTGGKQTVMWDPPGIRHKGAAPLSEYWGGSGDAYALAAGALNLLLSGRGVLHAKDIDLNQTLNVTAWRTQQGRISIMAANLEEGLRNDADMTRHAVLVLPKSWRLAKWSDAWTHRKYEARDGGLKIDLKQAASKLLVARVK
ncbi:MAG: hypothetical protein P8Z30_05525 [Acidobacteriota bacterium]